MKPANQPIFLRRWIFSMICLALASFFAFIAYWLYSVAGRPSDFLPKLAEYALQISVIALAGAAVKEFLDWRSTARGWHDRQEDLRGEFLRRLREIHVQVMHSRYLMRVHNSAKSWAEQSRSLIERTYQLEELSEDLKASPGLFGEQKDIVAGIEEMISYLVTCRNEYAARHADVDASGRTPLEDTIRAHSMPWTKDFFLGEGTFRSQYERNLLKSKLPMRRAVFGATLSNQDASATA